MKRVIVLLLLLHPASAIGADYDKKTLEGMDAVVREDWLAAVRAFDQALVAAPEDEARIGRLKSARKAGAEFWADRGLRLAELDYWHDAAVCAALAAHLDPDNPKTKSLARRASYKSTLPKNVEELLVVCPAYPERGLIGKLAARESLGDPFSRAMDITEGCLDWLAKNQAPNGGWVCTAHGGSHALYDTGVTALALSALLGEGPGALRGPRAEAIRKAAAFLAKCQSGEGSLGGTPASHFLYSHCAATAALAEYAALSGENEPLMPVLKRAGELIQRCQNPGSGWRYGIRPGDSDTSVTFWAVAALEALRKAELKVDAQSLSGALAWVNAVTDQEYGRVGYTETGNGPARLEKLMDRFPPDKSEALTAAGCLIRCYAGRPDSPLNRKGMGLMRNVPPHPGKPDMYYWHLGSRAFVALTGTVHPSWYRSLVDAAGVNRATDGSINPSGPWGESGGRVMSTAFTALALMAPYSEPGPGGVEVTASDFLQDAHRKVKVVPDDRATPTGIYVESGMKIHVVPAGTIQTVPGTKSVGPAGHKSKPKKRERITRAGPYGCLLGRLGPDGKPFAIKRKGKLSARGRGHLYLLVNDPDLSRASGAFEVEFILK